MLLYGFKRCLLVIPTLLGALLLNFLLLQMIPGNPLDHLRSKAYGIGRQGGDVAGMLLPHEDLYGGRLPEDYVGTTMGSYGGGGSLWHQFTTMARHYLTFDLGESYYQGASVMALIMDRLPVSLSLGLLTTLASYILALMLGLWKARREGSAFDTLSSAVLTFFYAMPSFLLSLLLIVLFAGGIYYDWFPLKGLVSEEFQTLAWWQKGLDYLHHLTLPFLAVVLGGLAGFVLFVKSAFLEQLRAPYVTALYARGGDEGLVNKHAFKHVVLMVVAHLPQSFLKIFFMSNLVVEMVFSLDGVGYLLFQGALQRDYPVVLGGIFIFTLIGLLVQLFVDLLYPLLDPRITFKGRTYA